MLTNIVCGYATVYKIAYYLVIALLELPLTIEPLAQYDIEYHSMIKGQMSTQKTCQKGVTLLEMMITVAIVAIVMTVVAPNVQNILIKNRIVAEVNEISSIIQYARNSAIDEQANAIVCPSSDFANCTTDWHNPKIVFIDDNDNQQRDNDEVLLVATERLGAVNTLQGPASGMISFDDSGAASAISTLKICHVSNVPEYARVLEVSIQGRVRLSQDTNANGVHESQDGTELTCP